MSQRVPRFTLNTIQRLWLAPPTETRQLVSIKHKKKIQVFIGGSKRRVKYFGGDLGGNVYNFRMLTFASYFFYFIFFYQFSCVYLLDHRFTTYGERDGVCQATAKETTAQTAQFRYLLMYMKTITRRHAGFKKKTGRSAVHRHAYPPSNTRLAG